MINLSIFLLSSNSYLNSPFFSNYNKINLKGCLFNRCFSHILLNNDQMSIYNSQFSNFLSQPIFSENKNVFRERLVYDKNSTLLIENSYFRNCKSVDSGGAIYYFSNSFNYIMCIKNTLFESCITENNGGAIFFSGERANMSRISAKMCNANIDGQFCHISTTVLRKGRITLDNILVSECSTEAMNGRYNSIYLKSGFQQISFLNSTNNFVSHSCSSLFISTPYDFSMKNCFYSNNRDTTLFEFYAKSNSTVTSVMFYNNSNQYQNKGIISFHSICNFSGCSFIQNRGLLFYRNRQRITLHECTLDSPTEKWSGVTLTSCRNYIPSRTVSVLHHSISQADDTIHIIYFGFILILLILTIAHTTHRSPFHRITHHIFTNP